MVWWAYVLSGCGVGIALGYWGWTGISIVQLHLQGAVLKERLNGFSADQQRQDNQQLRLEQKLDKIADDTARILGTMEKVWPKN